MGQPAKVLSVTPVSNAKLNEIKSKNKINNTLTVFAYNVKLDNGDDVNIIVRDANNNKQSDADDVFKVIEGDKVTTFDKKLVNNVEKKVITLDANTLKTELSKVISGTAIKTDNTPSYAFTLSSANSNPLKSLLTNKAVTAPDEHPGATKMNTGNVYITELPVGTKSIQLTIYDRNKNGIVDNKDAFQVGTGVKSVIKPNELIDAMKAAKISIEYEDADATRPTWDKVNEQNLKQVNTYKDKISNKASDICPLSSLYSPVVAPTNATNTATPEKTPAKVVTNPVATPEAPATPAASASSSSNIPEAISFTSEQLDSLKEYGITQAVIDDVNNLPVDKLNKLFTATPGESNVHIDGLSLKMKRNLAILQKAAASKGIVLPTVNSAFRTYDEQEALFKKYGSSRAAEPGSSWHEDKDGKGGNAIDFKDSGNSDNRVLAGIWTKMGNRWGGSFKTGIKEPWHFDLGSPSGSPDSIDRDSFNSFNMVMGNPFMNFFNLMDYSALGYNFGFCAASLAGAGNLYDTSYFNYEDKFFGSILGNLASFTNKLATGSFTVPNMFGGYSYSSYSALPKDLSEQVEKYSPIIETAASKNQVDSKLICSMIKRESGFNPSLTSEKGAKGLMQLMPDTAKGLGVTDSFDPQQNIDGGTKYIADLLNQFHGNTKLALAAYNWGPSHDILTPNASYDAIESKLPPETQKYVREVMNNYNTFDQWGVKKKPVV